MQALNTHTLLSENSSIFLMSTIAGLILGHECWQPNPKLKSKSHLKRNASDCLPRTMLRWKLNHFSSGCVGSLGVMWLGEDFLKENISVTNNTKFLCLVNLNYYVYLNVPIRSHLHVLLIFFKAYWHLILFGIASNKLERPYWYSLNLKR